MLGKHDGSLGVSGSVAWMFARKGYLEILLKDEPGKPAPTEDELMEIAVCDINDTRLAQVD